jgi:catechol 2,3-dioxygenase-like lactoylglutathione lyase family enzyme
MSVQLNHTIVWCRDQQKSAAFLTEHSAFLIGDADFAAAYARVCARGLEHRADPARTQPGEINRHFGGRGVSFKDPDGHLPERITRRYASASAALR